MGGDLDGVLEHEGGLAGLVPEDLLHPLPRRDRPDLRLEDIFLDYASNSDERFYLITNSI